MPNTLSVYDPIFYAQEALIQLEKALGMAARVHRGYDKTPQDKGSTIEIPVPGTFSAQNAPSAAQDLAPSKATIVLNQWKEVKFKLSDKELTFTKEKIIDDHIRPAAYALADDIDNALNALYADVPWFIDVGATAAVADVVAMNKMLFDNKVPLADEAMIHWEIDSDMYADLSANAAFSQWQGSGQAGADTQMSGQLGRRFGMNFFRNQNVKSHTPGVSADATGTATGAHAKGATAITVGAVTIGGTVKKGDSFSIAGQTQRYVFTADATADGGGSLNAVPIYPALAVALAGGEVVTISLDAHSATLAFHRNAFALAMAPLSDIGNQLGARIATIADPITNLALRSRMYYVGDSSEVHVALDVLYGVKTLDGNLAARGRN
jgi:hypothetical protein